ncbi:hypothetical protein [Paenibacillus popilliae]|uniref:Intein/homing endonuclease n=1 Tax=Paenibacillus popilliae ATCC 14706 TaxID=1212764 RepID=M9LP65_PAEPP|nr:hypothetical protein [Paenibacillus popilliae]GAC42241.1 intein/homing endonuclease [Paenibacillus popilliae ATCC 14706]
MPFTPVGYLRREDLLARRRAVSPYTKKSGLKAAHKFAYPLLIVPNGREKAQYRKSAADRLPGDEAI